MNIVIPSHVKPYQRHRLDPARIIETAENLAHRINEKLPGTTLSALAVELARIASATEARTRSARRPIYAIRLTSWVVVGVSLMGIIYLIKHINTRWEFATITELFEATDAGFNLLVLLAGALWFFVTIEARIKRRKALHFIEELREFIHVIDVTQLYFTPVFYHSEQKTSSTSPNFDYTYLLFCTQMLTIISNLVPLYTRGAAGDSILRAVSEVEMLANAISTTLLSKAESVRLTTSSPKG